MNLLKWSPTAIHLSSNKCSAKAKYNMSASLPQQWFDRAREDLQVARKVNW
jgi:hypothetical protein